MKTKYIFRAIILLLIPLLFYFVNAGFRSSPEKKETAGSSEINRSYVTFSPQQKDFTNFMLNTAYYDTPRSWDMQNFINYYRGELNFNGVHIYDKDTGNGRHGKFNIDLTGPQIDSMQALIDMAQTRGLKSVFERTKISRLCYGQRLVYEAEGGNYGFSYDYSINEPIPDSGGYVVHACPDCPPSSSLSEGMLCEDIYENMQHTDLFYFPPNSGDTSNWHVKPRMRIKQSDFNANDTRRVVAIITRNFQDSTIDSVIIHVNNFRDVNNNYAGQYIDKYRFEQNADSLLVSGSLSIGGLNHGYTGPDGYHAEDSEVDFKVYWFGEVEVWFDKMTVDNEIANGLFANEHDNKIDQELSNFSNPLNGNTMGMYFVDECTYSQLPCIKYVQNYIRNYNSIHGTNAVLSYATSNNLNKYSIRTTANEYNLYLDSTKPDYFQLDAHCFFYDDDEPGYISPRCWCLTYSASAEEVHQQLFLPVTGMALTCC